MKNIFCLSLSAAGLLIGNVISGVSFAGVPVIDGGAVTQRAQLANLQQQQQQSVWVKQAADMLKQSNQLQQQIQQFQTASIGSLFGSINTTGLSVADQGATNYAGTFTAAANKYLGEQTSQCTKTGSGNNPNYQACIAQRNMKAGALQEMQSLLKGVEVRSQQINTLLAAASKGTKTPGQMQAYQFQISTIQAQIQNDLARMQLSIAVYKQREELYRQQQRDSARKLLTSGGSPVSLKSALGLMY